MYDLESSSKGTKSKKKKGKGRRSTKKRSNKELPDPTMTSMEDICNELQLNNVDLEYTDEDFEQITSAKVCNFFKH